MKVSISHRLSGWVKKIIEKRSSSKKIFYLVYYDPKVIYPYLGLIYSSTFNFNMKLNN